MCHEPYPVRRKRSGGSSQESDAALGLSLNQAIRNYLEELAGTTMADDDIREMGELSRASKGGSRGWKFDRDELHERS